MRSQVVRLLQWWMVGLTILVALAIGYVTADLLTRGPTGAAGSLQLLPSSTPLPASTPAAPSPVASPASVAVETATPANDEIATPSPEIARVFINESFDTVSRSWPSQTSDRWSAGYADGRYQLLLNGQTSVGVNARPPDDVTNYSIDVDVTVEAGGAGVVFLFAEPQQAYRLIISNDGAYAIEYQDGNDVVQTLDWTASEALRTDPGATNRLRFERRGDTISFFANEAPLTTFDIPEGEWTNRFGLVITARSGNGLATFDNLRGERLESTS